MPVERFSIVQECTCTIEAGVRGLQGQRKVKVRDRQSKDKGDDGTNSNDWYQDFAKFQLSTKLLF